MVKPKRRKEIFTLIVVFTGVVLLSALAVYYLGGARRATPDAARPAPQQPDAILGSPADRASPTPESRASESFIDSLFGTRHGEAYLSGDTWLQTMGRIGLRLLLASLLGA